MNKPLPPPCSSEGKRARFRDYQQGDEGEICALFETVFGKTLDQEQWDWKYRQSNPEGQVFAKIATSEDGRIIGHAGAICLGGTRDGHPTPVFQIVDVMVHPAWRGGMGQSNVFTRLLRELLETLREWGGEHTFAYGFPGDRPCLVGERAGVYARIENIHVNKLTTARFSWLWVNPLKWNDRRLDSLWKYHAHVLGIAVARDRSYLRWRYQTNPFFSYRLLGLHTFSGLQGWAVVREERDMAHIIDLLLPPAWVKQGLHAVRRHLVARCGFRHVDFWLPRRLLDGIAVTSRPTGAVATNMTWCLSTSGDEAGKHFYYTMGDADIH